MKTIGLISGKNYPATSVYYNGINGRVNARLGGWHSAKIYTASVDSDDCMRLMNEGDWQKIADKLSKEAVALQKLGVDAIAITSNTLHKVADQVIHALNWRASMGGHPVELIRIGDAVAKQLRATNLRRVGLLGTKVIMEDDFMRKKLKENGLELVPVRTQSVIEDLNTLILREISRAHASGESRRFVTKVVDELAEDGADGIILGSAELRTLISKEARIIKRNGGPYKMPLLDTVQAHIDALVDFCLSDERRELEIEPAMYQGFH